jgi:flavin reductase (DIM6/NTAB) family NADH-FMN oxidoreductase RutF
MKVQIADLEAGLTALPPFPVVLVTVGNDIMTAGAFHFYSFDPPSVMVGIMPQRYTYELINQAGEFGINLPTAAQVALARTCGSVSGRRGVDKYARAGVTPFRGSVIASSLIAECPVNLECVVVHEVDYPGTHHWYVGEIKVVHIDEDYTRDQPLMFWNSDYHRVGEVLEKAW